MKRFLVLLAAFAVAVLPVTASAFVPESVLLSYDDGVFEPPPFLLNMVTAPVVQFDNPTPGTGVYALESVTFTLDAAVVGTYPLAVQVWDDTLAVVATIPWSVDVLTAGSGPYSLDLSGELLTFSTSLRVGVFTRVDPLITAPGEISLAVDTTSAAGHSHLYDSAPLPPATTWTDAGANYGIEASVHLVPQMTCQGFLPPLNRTITMKRGGRNIPIKALLFDETGAPLTGAVLAKPPVVKLLWAPDATTPAIEVTDFVAPGDSNAGQTFRNTYGGKWRYNLKTKKFYAPGIYTVQVESGDGMEYAVDPTCTGTFEIEGPKSKKGPKPKK